MLSDIRTLERQKRDLLSDLDRLNKVKEKELATYHAEIRDLTRRRNDLMLKVDQFKKDFEELSLTFESTQKEFEDLQNIRMQNLNTEIERAKNNISEMERQALSKKNDADKRIEEAAIKEQHLQKQQEVVINQGRDLVIAKRLFSEERQAFLAHKPHIEEEMRVLENKRDTLQLLITALTAQIYQLKEKIEKDTKQSLETSQKLEEREKECQLKEQALNQRALIIAEQEEILHDKQMLLRDRENSLETAISEWRQKGVQLHG